MLLCDDEPFNLIPLQVLLEEQGIVSCETTSGQEAVQKFQENLEKTCCSSHFKMVLMDIQMPDIDGHEAAKQIIQIAKNSANKRLVPVIAVSGFFDQKEVDKCYESGMVEAVNKPVNINDLNRIVATYHK